MDVAILKDRHLSVGVLRQIGRLAVAAERTADVDPLERLPRFAGGPHHLLDIHRAQAPQNLQHRVFPS